ncbi:MAG: hypothetical protein KGK08_14385 [Acidobacteriota bacterium]|nr:hypothetical protein [Acidobacteriota bacterium]
MAIPLKANQRLAALYAVVERVRRLEMEAALREIQQVESNLRADQRLLREAKSRVREDLVAEDRLSRPIALLQMQRVTHHAGQLLAMRAELLRKAEVLRQDFLQSRREALQMEQLVRRTLLQREREVQHRLQQEADERTAVRWQSAISAPEADD